MSVSSKTRQLCRRDSYFGGGQQKGFRVWLALAVVSGADQHVEFMQQLQRIERCGDRFARAAGNNRKGNPAVLRVNMLHHFRDRFQLRQQLEIDVLLSCGHRLHRHVQSLLLVEHGNDLRCRHAAQSVEELLVKCATPFPKGLLPGDVVQRHGIGNRAVAIE